MNSKGGTIAAILFCVIILFACGKGCGGSSSSSSYDSGYSDQYNYDSNYRSNVDSTAKSWGTSSKEVDSKIQAVTGGK